MNLKLMLNGIEETEIIGNVDIEINKIEMDSRLIKENDIFVAIKGFDTDGHNFITNAIQNGAVAVVVENDYNISMLPKNITKIIVPNTRKALAVMASNYYENPTKKLKMIGVTGTKGKTTTTFMIKAILEKMGHKVGLIGSISTYLGKEKLFDNERTTPDSLKLQEIFSKMVEENVDTVVMEVSSQSTKLYRVYGIEFNIGVFTNFSEDHISPKEHPNMEDYFNSKAQLFNNCKIAFLNADDKNVMKITGMNKPCAIKTYGIKNNSDIMAKNIHITNSYVEFKINMKNTEETIKVAIPGVFSVYNALAAISVTTSLNANMNQIKKALETISVPGRSELVPNKLGLTVMVDFSHSPEALRNILASTKEYSHGKIILVFGCGGNRDALKRPIMGEIAGKMADFTIITSDNPRFEEPISIINQIEGGIKKTEGKYICIENRVDAIKYAISMASKDDIVILAGKGHEPYQEIKGEKFAFDEKKIVTDFIESIM